MKIRKTDRIAIVGGGTAGLVSALILKTKFPNKQIDVISSKQLGIIGVGEGVADRWREFMDCVGIDQYDMIAQTDASCKWGILFTNWTEKPYWHSIQTPYDLTSAQYRCAYGKLIGDGRDNVGLTCPTLAKGLVPVDFLNNSKKYMANQFHFDTYKLNNFLTNIAKKKGINLIDDIIDDVVLDVDGYVKSIIGKHQTYDYDFYIDSTGFKKIIINKLGAEWQSYSKYLKMKSAIVFQTPEEETIPGWTLSHAMDNGWLFRIPTQSRFGNGYIFDTDYINAEQAKLEVEQYFGHEVSVNKTLTFDPGALKNVWIKNCVAIGLSASFVEPLEASSIATTIQQSFMLAHRLENYTQPTIDIYNKAASEILENIRDFVILHYLTKKDNTQFWKDVSKIEIPESLQSKLNLWKHKLPMQEDFSGLSRHILFWDASFTMVLHGLGHFNVESIKKEYDACDQFTKNRVETTIANHEEYRANVDTIPHKQFLESIKQYQTIDQTTY